MKKVKEGLVEVFVYREEKPTKSRAFYNKRMELNRDLSIATAKVFFKNKKIRVCEPLAATGIRGIRYAKEVSNTEVVLNDVKKSAFDLIEKNVKLNKCKNIRIFNENANLTLSREKFDLVDIDPFGTPAPFLDSGLRALKNNSLLGVTATDAPALCGVYPKVALRNYGGVSLRTEYCHEIGIRLLLGAIAKTAAKYERGIEVLLSLSLDHYFRVFLKVKKGAKRADNSLKKLGFIYHCFKCNNRKVVNSLIAENKKCGCGKEFEIAGPLWVGKLFDKEICRQVREEVMASELGTRARLLKNLDLMLEEADASATYYDVHRLFRGSCPKMEVILKKYKATRTHFSPTAIRTKAPVN